MEIPNLFGCQASKRAKKDCFLRLFRLELLNALKAKPDPTE